MAALQVILLILAVIQWTSCQFTNGFINPLFLPGRSRADYYRRGSRIYDGYDDPALNNGYYLSRGGVYPRDYYQNNYNNYQDNYRRIPLQDDARYDDYRRFPNTVGRRYNDDYRRYTNGVDRRYNDVYREYPQYAQQDYSVQDYRGSPVSSTIQPPLDGARGQILSTRSPNLAVTVQPTNQ